MVCPADDISSIFFECIGHLRSAGTWPSESCQHCLAMIKWQGDQMATSATHRNRKLLQSIGSLNTRKLRRSKLGKLRRGMTYNPFGRLCVSAVKVLPNTYFCLSLRRDHLWLPLCTQPLSASLSIFCNAASGCISAVRVAPEECAMSHPDTLSHGESCCKPDDKMAPGDRQVITGSYSLAWHGRI